MFAAMAAPLKGAGGSLSPAKKRTAAVLESTAAVLERLATYSEALRFTAAERPRSVAIS